MSGMVNVALYFPRYMLIAGLTVLALGPLRETLIDLWAGETPDFEQLLPLVSSCCGKAFFYRRPYGSY